MTASDLLRLPTALPRAVIFDLDGLMLDSERWERSAWQTVARGLGYTVTDEFYASLVGRRELDTGGMLQQYFGPEFALDEFRTAVKAHLRVQLAQTGVPLKAGLIELLDTLDEQRIVRAIASSSTRDSGESRLGALINRFDSTVFGDEVRHGKPDPEIYRLAASRLQLPPQLCVALEDSPVGLTAAEAAGVTAILVPDLVPAPAEARYVCNSLKDIVNWFQAAVDREFGGATGP